MLHDSLTCREVRGHVDMSPSLCFAHKPMPKNPAVAEYFMYALVANTVGGHKAMHSTFLSLVN